jgi:hypothetical protein
MESGGIDKFFLTSALGEGEWSVSRLNHFNPGKEPRRYPADMSTGNPKAGLNDVEKILEPYTESRNSQRPKRDRRVKIKVMSMLIIFFVIKGIAHKEFVLAGQIVIPHTTVTFYGDCVKMCENFAPNFGDKRIGC